MKVTYTVKTVNGFGRQVLCWLPGLAMLLLSPTAAWAQEAASDALSREISVYLEDDPEMLQPTDAISRELSIQVESAQQLDMIDTISRQISVFNDSMNQVEATDTISRESSVFLVRTLELALPVSDTMEVGEQAYFLLTTPPDLTVRIALDHVSDTAWTELYASFGELPTDADAEFVFDNPAAPDQELIIPNTEAGTYYIMARRSGEGDPGAANGYTILAEDLPFGLRSVEPGVIGAGVVTLQVNGARLTADTSYAVVDWITGSSYTPEESEFLDPATALVRFDMSSADLGFYDLVATGPGGLEAVLTEGLEVAEPSDARFLDLQLEFPAAIRGGRPAEGLINIVNTGNVDIPFVEAVVITDNDERITLWCLTIEGLYADPADDVIQGFLVYVADLRPGESRAIGIGALASTDYPAHGLLPITVAAVPHTLESFRDGPLFHLSEETRLAALAAPDSPPELLAVAAGSEAWWQSVSEYFDQHGLSGGRQSGGRSAGGGMSTFECSVLCTVVGLGVGTLNPIAGAAAGVLCTAACNDLSGRPVSDEQAACMIAGGIVGMIGGPAGGAFAEFVCNHMSMEVVQSGDPNEKVGAGGYGEGNWRDSTSPLPYHIDFENLPEATASAAEIYITDVLAPTLDPATLRVGDIRFGETMIEVPPGRSSYHTIVDLLDEHGVLVEVCAGVDVLTREVYFSLRALDPDTMQLPWDPTLGFLPPNDETGRGGGYVEFTIAPCGDVQTGTVVTNQASIVFDYNDPIETNEVFNTIDAGPPVTAVRSLPAISAGPFVLRWTGEDDEEGSGLAQYQIYVSADGEPPQLWYTGTETWAHFEGQAGSSYEFYSVGVDNVGNMEAVPLVPQASTMVVGMNPNGDLDLHGDTDSGGQGASPVRESESPMDPVPARRPD